MKKFICIILLLSIVSIFVSCASNSISKGVIVGTWSSEIESIEDTKVIFTFSENGTVTQKTIIYNFNIGTMEDSGTYKIKGDAVIATFSDREIEFKYSTSGGTAKLINENGVVFLKK